MNTTLHNPVDAAPDATLGMDDVSDLLRAVNETTAALQQTHDTLRAEVGRLNAELTEANRKLKRSEQLAALGEMAAGIAHEIRNPLGSIQLYTQMLGEDVGGDEASGALCDKISRAVGGIDAIVRDVLMFARDMTIRCERLSAADLLRGVTSACDGLIAAHEVRVDLEAEDTIHLTADAALLHQALGNILRNAIEAMAEHDCAERCVTAGAAIRTVRCPDGTRAARAVLSVADTGPGIPDAVVSRMFNPFFTTRSTGTGLGLAIVHRIVDAHDGFIDVRSRSDGGGGAVVELCLPIGDVVDG